MVALGYTMVYGIIKLLNFAHGDIYMVGGFVGLITLSLLSPFLGAGWAGILVAMIISMILVGLLGVLIQRIRTRHASAPVSPIQYASRRCRPESTVPAEALDGVPGTRDPPPAEDPNMDLGVCVATHIGDIDYVVRAEALGYSHAWFADSQMLWSDCYAALALAATRTSRIRRSWTSA